MTSVGSVELSLTLDTSSFNRTLSALSKTQLDDLSVAASLDTTRIQSDLRGLQGLKVPAIKVGATLDTTQIRRELDALYKIDGGAIAIDTQLNRSQFDRDVRSLSSAKVKPININVKLSKQSMERQLRDVRRGDYGTVEIDVTPNLKGFERQLRDLTKSLVSTIGVEVEPNLPAFKKKLEAIAQTNIDCLPIELCPDIEGFRKKLETLINIDIDCIPIDLCPDLDGLDRQVKQKLSKSNYKTRAEIKPVDSPDALGKKVNNKVSLEFDGSKLSHSLTTAVRDGIKGNIFENIGSTLLKTITGVGGLVLGAILLPIKAAAIAAGVLFTGVGLQIGEQLSKNLAAGLNSSLENLLSNSIGSTNLLGQKLGDGIVESLASVLRQKFGSTLDSFTQNVNLGDIARQAIGEEDVYVESRSRKKSQESLRAKQRKQARSQLSQELDIALVQQPRASELKQQINAQQPHIDQKTADFGQRFQLEKERLQQEASKISLTFTPESLYEYQLELYNQKNAGFRKHIAKIEESGDVGGASKARQLLGALKPPNKQEIDQKQVNFYNEFYTSQARGSLIKQGLKPLNTEKAIIEKEVAAHTKLLKEYESITKAIGTAFNGLELTGGLKPGAGLPQVKPLPLYESIVEQVAQASGVKIPSGLAPQLAISKNAQPGLLGTYDPKSNQIDVSKEAHDLIQAGLLDVKAIETLVHELRHAIQFDFGRADVKRGEDAATQLLKATPEEATLLGRRIEGSVGLKSIESQPTARALETDAYVFAQRNTASIAKNLTRQSFENAVGVGGSKVDLQLQKAQKTAIQQLSSIHKIAEQYGIDIRGEIQQGIAAFGEISNSIAPLLVSASNAEDLSTQEIEELREELESLLSSSLEAVSQIPNSIKAKVIASVESQKPTSEPPKVDRQEVEANLNRLNIKDLAPIAKQFGVTTYNKETKKKKSKAETVQSLLNNVSHEELQKALPVVGIPSTEVLTQSQHLAKLPVEKVATRIDEKRKSINESVIKTKELQGGAKTSALTQVLNEIKKEEELVAQALAQNLDKLIRNKLKNYRLTLSRKEYEVKDKIAQQNIAKYQPQTVSQGQSIKAPQQMNDNSFASLGDIREQVNAAREQLLNAINPKRMPGGKAGVQANRYIKQMEAEARAAEAAATEAAKVNAKSAQAANRLLLQAEIEEKYRASLNLKLQQLEQTPLPPVGVGSGGQRAEVPRPGFLNKIKNIATNPVGYAENRRKNSVISKARYATENAESLAGLVSSKVGASATPTQAKSLVSLQQGFENLGVAAENFGKKSSGANFKQLEIAVQALERDLRKLGLPFATINKEIDVFTSKLKRLQGEGTLGLDFDIEAVTPQKFNSVNEAIGQFSGLGLKAVSVIGDLVKGFLAFQAVSLFQNAITGFAKASTEAAITLDRLQTAIDYASGGATAGAKNLAFVRAEVDRLKIPLASSQEGFTQLTAATKGTSLEGQATKDIFTGVSEAATVLSLSADQTSGIFTALTQIASKGTVQAEELRGQLGERIPGAFSIAARAMGVTEAQLSKLMETGRVAADDFFPRFGRQLRAEFGDAALTASNNAQSANFDLQNSTLKLQESFGKSVQPAFLLGLNAASAAMKLIASDAKSLIIILLEIGVVVAVPLLKPIVSLISKIGLVSAALSGLKNSLVALKAAALPMIGTFVGITAALEIFKAGSQLIYGGPLTRQFDALVDAGKKAVKAFKGVKKDLIEEINQPLPPSNLFDYAINFANSISEDSIRVSQLPEKEKKQRLAEFQERKLTSYADLDRDRAVGALRGTSGDLSTAADLAFKEVDLVKSGKSNLSLLPKLDIDIKGIADQRKILQGRIQREFTVKGLQIPAEFRTQLLGLDEAYNKAVAKQKEVAKGGTDQYTALNRDIEAARATLRSFDDPSVIKQFGGEAYVAPLREVLQAALDKAEPAKDALANLLAVTKADPILAFADAFRKLNLELARNAEATQLANLTQKEAIAKRQVAEFKSNPLASQDAALATAKVERDRIASELKNQETDFQGKRAAVAAPEFKATLDRFALTPQSTAADIQGAIDRPGTEKADKDILEQVKTAKEAEIKLHETRTQLYESESKLQEQRQQNALNNIQRFAANAQAISDRTEATETARIRKQLTFRKITEEKGAEELAYIQYGATARSVDNTAIELAALRNYYDHGEIGAKEFHDRERDLVTRQSTLKKQLAEQEGAVYEAVYARVLAQLDLANKKAEAAIALSQTVEGTNIKRLQVGPDQVSQYEAGILNVQNSQDAGRERVKLLKAQIDQNEYAEKNGLITAKRATEERIRLTQQLAETTDKLVSDAIEKEKILQAELDKTFERYRALVDLRTAGRDKATSQANLSELQAPGLKDLKALEFNASARSLSDKRDALHEQEHGLKEQLSRLKEYGYSAQEEADKRQAIETQLTNNQKEQLEVRRQEFENNQKAAVYQVERRAQVEKNRSNLAIASIDHEKGLQDLLNKSLERTVKLAESRASLSKALSDAAIASSQIQLDAVNRAGELRKRLQDEELDPAVRGEISQQLSSVGLSAGASELEFAERRQSVEADIAAKKLAALKTEQEFDRQKLRLDLQRERISLQMGAYEAETNQIKAEQAIAEAKSELQKAERARDAVAVEAAQYGLAIALRQLEISNKQLSNSKEGLLIQGELYANAIKAQDATQQAALDQARAAEDVRRRQGTLDRLEATVKKQPSTGGTAFTTSPEVKTTRERGAKDPKPLSAFEQSRLNLFAPQSTFETINSAPVHNANVTHNAGVNQSGHRGLNQQSSVEAYFQRQLGLDPTESREKNLNRQQGLGNFKSVEEYFNARSGLIPPPITTNTAPADTTKTGAIKSLESTDKLGILQDAVVKRLDFCNSILGQLLELGLSQNEKTGLNRKITPQFDRNRTYSSLYDTESPSTKGLKESGQLVTTQVENSSGYSNFITGLKEAGMGRVAAGNEQILAQLIRMNEALEKVARAPKSLTVVSNDPVDHAARIYGDISEGNSGVKTNSAPTRIKRTKV